MQKTLVIVFLFIMIAFSILSCRNKEDSTNKEQQPQEVLITIEDSDGNILVDSHELISQYKENIDILLPWSINSVNNDRLAVVDFKGDKVVILNHQGEYIRSFGAGELIQPKAQYINKKEEIYISDSVGLKKYTLEGEMRHAFMAFDELFHFTVADNGDIYVARRSGNGEEGSSKPMAVYSSKGSKLFEVDISKESELPFMPSSGYSSPCIIDGKIYLVNVYISYILEFDMKGKLLREIKILDKELVKKSKENEANFRVSGEMQGIIVSAKPYGGDLLLRKADKDLGMARFKRISLKDGRVVASYDLKSRGIDSEQTKRVITSYAVTETAEGSFLYCIILNAEADNQVDKYNIIKIRMPEVDRESGKGDVK